MTAVRLIKIVGWKCRSIVLPVLPEWMVWAEAVAADVAEATPTAPASTISLDGAVVTPDCWREDPGISSAENGKKKLLEHYNMGYIEFCNTE